MLLRFPILATTLGLALTAPITATAAASPRAADAPASNAAAERPAATALTAARGSIRVRHAVRLPTGRDRILLRDIAVIDGPDAALLGTVDLGAIDSEGTPRRVTLDDVRAALDAAGVHPARVTLRGRTARVQPGGVATRTNAPSAMTGRRIVDGRIVRVDEDGPADHPERAADGERDAAVEAARDARFVPAESLVDEPAATATVRGEIVRDLVRTLLVAPSDLRIAFPESQVDLLDRELGGGRVIVRRRSDAVAGAISYAVTSRRAGQPASTQTVMVNPEIRSTELVLVERLRPNTPIRREHVRSRSAWVPAGSVAPPANLQATLGSTLRRSLLPGTVLRERDLRMPVLVNRNDRVVVRVITPSMYFTQEGEARERGHLGQSIRIRGEGEGEEFEAEVVGPGVVQIDLRSGIATR